MRLQHAVALTSALLLSGCLACEDGSRFRFGDGGPQDASALDAGPDAGTLADAGPFDAGSPQVEACNDVDDDFDGLVDESCALSFMSLSAELTCARTVTGEVVCAGDGQLGQLGDGEREVRGTLRRVPGLAGITDLAVGNAHVCALAGNGGVSCWGFGSNGRLGPGASEIELRPRPVQNLEAVEALAAGRAFSCALIGGQVFCWGANGSGQTGNGARADHAELDAVVGLNDAVEIALGDRHACVVHETGGVSCFGDNTFMQVAEASPPISDTPVAVSGRPMSRRSRSGCTTPVRSLRTAR